MLLKNIAEYDGIFIACGVTDLRKSVDGLANIVKRDFQMDPFGNCIFLFCNRARNRMKGLTWDKNGFCLCYKRLDGPGARFQWPGSAEAVRAWSFDDRTPSGSGHQTARPCVRGVKIGQLRLLLDGMSIDPPRGFGEIEARDF